MNRGERTEGELESSGDVMERGEGDTAGYSGEKKDMNVQMMD
jgi:hypothetical protein